MVMVHYGSSVTGLVSTLTQFASMFTIIEGGFSVAVVVAAYEPILNSDYDELNSILYTAKKYFNRITVIYVSLVMLIGIVYVYYLEAPIGYFYALLLLALTTSTTALSICGLTKYTVVFAGHNKQYITTIVGIICKTITWAISLVLIANDYNIVVVYALNTLNIILNVLSLKYYEKKCYPYISYHGVFDLSKIHGVKDILFQKIASAVFTSTDLILVSLGLSLSKASVYYVYNAIYSGVYQYLSALSSAPTDSFGQLIKSNQINGATEIFQIYKKTVVIISTVFFTVATVMIIPFIEIYTRNINDENYIIPSLAIIFFSYFYLKLNNMPYGMIINVAGEFEKQNVQTGVATLINLVCSLIAMRYIGLNGIVLGSAVGTLVIIVANIIKAREIIAFNVKYDIIILIFNYVLSLLVANILKYFIGEYVDNYITWAIVATIVLILVMVIIVLFNYFLDRNYVKKCITYFFNKFNK